MRAEGSGPAGSGPEAVVFNVQRFSVHDGPGIRTTVFLKGCPLACAWCHNPEGRDPDPELSLLPGRCIRCEDCVEACPEHAAFPAFRVGEAGWAAKAGKDGERGRCLRCGACVDACPAGARVLMGQPWTVDALLEEVERDRVFYEESGGGVTFSGGEPLMPPRNAAFLLACLRAAGERGLHRAVDTSGHVPADTLAQAAPLIDLFLYDLKHMDDGIHRRLTGVGNERVLENLKRLDATGSEIWIRVPLIPGVNDDAANLEAMTAFVASLSRPHPIHLLPYHRVGGDKYGRLGVEYALGHLTPPAEARVAALAEHLRAGSRLEIRVGG